MQLYQQHRDNWSGFRMGQRLVRNLMENLIMGIVQSKLKERVSSCDSVWVTLWFCRCSYAQLCYYILEDGSLTSEQFANELLPSLLSLGSDRIPNVRIALAKVLAQHIMHSGQSHPEVLFREGVPTVFITNYWPWMHCWPNRETLTSTLCKRLVVLVDYFTGATNPHHEDLLINVQWLYL